MLAVAAVLVAGPAGPAAARQGPGVLLSAQRAAPGATLTVSGAGWRPGTLLTLLICGQNMIGGTNACANADGRAVTTDASGSFSAGLPVVAPPRPCPCVVHVATVTGERHAENAVLAVAGHPTAPLPRPRGPGKLAALTTARLEGDSGLLVLFGAPPSRRLSLTVGNLGTTPVENPVFRLGVSHGVYAPRWEERRWRGTIAPGAKARITLDVELAAGAHGDYGIAVRYAGRTIADRPWDVGRPWGVTAFWVLLALVAPAAVFRVGMAVVDHLRPAGPAETTAAGKAKDRRPGGVPGQRPCRCGGESGGSGGSGGSGPAGQPGTGVS
nr:neocarzinostatin apoprotein domain-containing protein [Streptomyces sp. YSPA8]